MRGICARGFQNRVHAALAAVTAVGADARLPEHGAGHAGVVGVEGDAVVGEALGAAVGAVVEGDAVERVFRAEVGLEIEAERGHAVAGMRDGAGAGVVAVSEITCGQAGPERAAGGDGPAERDVRIRRNGPRLEFRGLRIGIGPAEIREPHETPAKLMRGIRARARIDGVGAADAGVAAVAADRRLPEHRAGHAAAIGVERELVVREPLRAAAVAAIDDGEMVQRVLLTEINLVIETGRRGALQRVRESGDAAVVDVGDRVAGDQRAARRRGFALRHILRPRGEREKGEERNEKVAQRL